MIVAIALAILCSVELAGAVETLFVTNVTTDNLAFVVVKTKITVTNRYTELQGNAVEYYGIYELLPGQNINVTNFKKSITGYDRALLVMKGNDAKSKLEAFMLGDKKFRKNDMYAIPAERTTRVFITEKGNQLVSVKESNAITSLANNYFKIGNAFANKGCNLSLRRTVQAGN